MNIMKREMTEEWVRQCMDEYNLPSHMASGMFLYLAHHISPGSFMVALLSNDLVGAIGRADHMNVNRIKEWADFMYNAMPGNAWGSPEIVQAWLAKREGA